MATRLIDLVIGAFVKGYVGKCPTCRQEFIGRKGATYCSATCRARAHNEGKETK